jgi:SAM-dependent methyltransferase
MPHTELARIAAGVAFLFLAALIVWRRTRRSNPRERILGREASLSNVHHSAVDGYTARADTYVRGRPEYPPEVDGWLRIVLRLRPNQKVLDLGAGTGKFSRKLLATGARVIALDPVPAMLEQLIRQYPDIETRIGSAESLPFEDESFDSIVCAQSFHWFATPESLVEIRRVLKPGGHLGLIWNVRDESVEWVAALTRIIEPFEGDTPRYRTQNWRLMFPADGFSQLQEQQFPNEHIGTSEQVIVERILSVSFIAALRPVEQDRVASQIRNLIAQTPELSGKSTVSFPYKTVALSCIKLTSEQTGAGE